MLSKPSVGAQVFVAFVCVTAASCGSSEHLRESPDGSPGLLDAAPDLGSDQARAADASTAEAPPAATDGAGCLESPPPEAAAARSALAALLAIPQAEIELVCVREATWEDGCLGVPSPELCAPGPVPGYIIELRARDRAHTYHSDRMGTLRYAGALP